MGKETPDASPARVNTTPRAGAMGSLEFASSRRRVAAALGVLCTFLAARSAAANPPPGVPPLGQRPQDGVICPDSSPPLTAGNDPRFVLEDDGSVTAADGGRPLAARITLRGGRQSVLLRLLRLNRAGTSAPQVVGCGVVFDGEVVGLPEARSDQRAVLVAEMYGTPLPEEVSRVTVLARGRRASLERNAASLERVTAVTRRQAITGDSDLQNAPTIVSAVDQFLGATGDDATRLKRELAVQALVAARRELGSLRTYHQCDVPTATGPYRTAICGELASIGNQFVALEGALGAPAGPMPDAAAGERVRALVQPLRADAVDADQRRRFCDDMATSRWLGLGPHTNRWLVARVQIPLVGDARIIQASYDSGERSIDDLPARGTVGVVIHEVPVGVQPTMEIRTLESVGSSAADSVVSVLRLFILAAAAGRQLPIGLAAAPAGVGSCDSTEYRVDPEMPTISSRTTFADVIPRLDPDRRSEIRICAGASCIVDGERANIRNRVYARPAEGAAFTFILEGAANLLPVRFDAPNEGLAYLRPEYRQENGTLGPDQLYRRHDAVDLRGLATLSLLAGVRVQNWFFGFGPTLIDGAGSKLLTQWNLRAGYRIAPRLYLTFGFSFLASPLQPVTDIPERVAVMREAGRDPTPPTVGYRDVFVLNFLSVGIGADLGILSDVVGYASNIRGAR